MKRMNRLARARPAQSRPPPYQAAEAVLEVVSMGARGEGVAASEGGPVYAPFALPGETVRARVTGERAEVSAIEQESPSRVAPACAAFGRCGGCQLQHWAEADYLAWKRGLVVTALERRGVAAAVEAIIPAWGEGRRRAAFQAVRDGGRVLFGFAERGGARLADIETCPVLAPGLAARLGDLRALARLMAPARGEVTFACLLTDCGVACDIKGAPYPEAALIERAQGPLAGFARVTCDGATLAQHRRPEMCIGRARVTPPPGGFAQPTAAGEAALARLALEAIAPARRVVDLFSGMGTFALRAAEGREVMAVDGDAAALAALKAGADGASLNVQTMRRDLLRTPLAALEMRRFDAVIFDPPRAGARLQAAEIARSRIERVAAVSCDAATFARDARTLIDGGFTLARVSPVDQFRYTPHAEIVGAFVR
jgi:23S rRNA (uracil1939-C5)-methyltransferase